MVETPQTRWTDGWIHPGYWLKKIPIDPSHSREKNPWKVCSKTFRGLTRISWRWRFFSPIWRYLGMIFFYLMEVCEWSYKNWCFAHQNFEGQSYCGHFSWWWVMVLEWPLHPKVYLWVSESGDYLQPFLWLSPSSQVVEIYCEIRPVEHNSRRAAEKNIILRILWFF